MEKLQRRVPDLSAISRGAGIAAAGVGGGRKVHFAVGADADSGVSGQASALFGGPGDLSGADPGKAILSGQAQLYGQQGGSRRRSPILTAGDTRGLAQNAIPRLAPRKL